MDQDAFRSLLATPARPAGSPSGTAAPSRFGLAPPKRQPAQHKGGASTDLKPRKVNSNASTSKPKRNPDGSLYRDRAAERRAGRDGDFADAEKLLEDFKARSETAGVSKDVLEDQMKYLGGDEHHSILVKGLDLALLEREKAKLAGKAESELENVEDELDAAFETAATASAAAPESPPSPPTAGPSRQRKGPETGPSTKTRAKTRDELIAEMKAMRAGGGGSAAAAAESRFKPIGSAGPDKKGKGKEGPTAANGGWKAVGADDEKKKRKKRKVVPATADGSTAEPKAAAAAGPSAGPAADQSKIPPAPAPLLPAGAPPPVEIDDDFDIFGDAGEYKGLDTDDDDEDEEGKPSGGSAAARKDPPRPPISTTGKRKYFDDDDDEEDAIQTSTAPGGMGDLAAKQAAADAAARAGRSGEGADEVADAEEGSDARPMRLEGFSGAGPSVKELLEMDKAAEAEEKRQARKLKAKEKAEARRANMTEADKANQDYQKMMSHLEKKDGGGANKKIDQGKLFARVLI